MTDKNPREGGKVAALDVGTKRIGIALTDALGIIPRPHATITFRDHRHAYEQLAQLFAEEEVKQVIAGLPVSTDGQLNRQAEWTEAFLRGLERHLQQPVLRVDESYSTQTAHLHMQQRKKRVTPPSGETDRLAAAFILQQYLDEQQGRAK
jgi:putative Holliday junction resolvase